MASAVNYESCKERGGERAVSSGKVKKSVARSTAFARGLDPRLGGNDAISSATKVGYECGSFAPRVHDMSEER